MNTTAVIKYPLVGVSKFVMSILVMTIHIPLGISFFFDHLIANTIARAAVPFFFLSSGYFFFVKKKLDKKKLQLIIVRLAILFVGWYAIYKVFAVYNYIRGGGNISNLLTELNWDLGHLWFIPALIFGLTLSYFTKKYINKSIGFFIVCLLLLIGIMGDGYLNLTKESHLPRVFFYYYFKIAPNTRNGFFFAFPLIMIASWLNPKKIKYISFYLLILLALVFVEHSIIRKHTWARDYNIYISIVIFAILFFQFVISVQVNINARVSLFFRKYSMGIYFLHPLIFQYIYLYFDKGIFIMSLISCIAIIFVFRLLNNKYTNYLFD